MKSKAQGPIALVFLVAPLVAGAQQPLPSPGYDVLELPIAVADNQSVVVAALGNGTASDLLVLNATRPAQRSLDLFELRDDGFGTGPALSREIGEDVIFADTGWLGDAEILVLFTAEEAIRYDPRRETRSVLVRYQSIYNLPFQDRVPLRDFFHDINGDGLDDFLIPGFHGLSAFLQGASGVFGPPILVAAVPIAEQRGPSVSYRTAPYFLAPDYPENRRSIVTVDDTGLQLHAGTADGGFEADPVLLSAAPPFDYPSLAEMEEDLERNQSDFDARALFDVADYDGDGLVDLLVYHNVSRGVFDKSVAFELYRGLAENGSLAFSAAASTAVVARGQPFGFDQRDIDGDGRLDVQLISAEIGLGKIVRALLTGSINVDLAFYLMQDTGYPENPNLRRNVRVEFDLGSGTISVPLNLLHDLDLDGREDLIVQSGQDSLEIFMGTGGEEIFRSEPGRIDVDLPSGLDNAASLAQDFVSFADINGDRIEDLLIVHQRRPPEAGKIVVLLSNGEAL